MTSPTFPNFEGKHREDALFGPAEMMAYLRQQGRLDGYQPPAAIVLCYPPSTFRRVLRAEGLDPDRTRRAHRGLVTLPSTDHRVGLLGQFGIGAPAAAALLEDFIALGTRRFLSIGTAGSLQPDLEVGAVVVCDRAVRDEGISHHYLPPARYVDAPTPLTDEVDAELAGRCLATRRGASWTIDAPYRETVAEARHYQSLGVLCVEMEAAALFAVAQHRGVEVACAFAVSDSLAELVWDPQFHSASTDGALAELIDAAIAVGRR